MTDEMEPTRRTREPFDDPVTGDQTLPGGEPMRDADSATAAAQVANAGTTSGLPGDLLAKPQIEVPGGPPEQTEDGKAADAGSATTGH